MQVRVLSSALFVSKYMEHDLFGRLKGDPNRKANDLWRKVDGATAGHIRSALYLVARDTESGNQPRPEDVEELANAKNTLSKYLKPGEIDFILNALVKNDIDPASDE